MLLNFLTFSQLVLHWLNYEAFVALDDWKTSIERVGLTLASSICSFYAWIHRLTRINIKFLTHPNVVIKKKTIKISSSKGLSSQLVGFPTWNFSIPVVQKVEHGASYINVVNSIPRKCMNWSNVYLECNVSHFGYTKCINVKYNVN